VQGGYLCQSVPLRCLCSFHSILGALLVLCRDNASNYVASSLLRKLLDSADSSLGPWVPGQVGTLCHLFPLLWMKKGRGADRIPDAR